MSISAKNLKRKAPPQSTTLLNFFNAKTPAKATNISSKPLKQNITKKLKGNSKSDIINDAAIIVIDSDDDEVTIIDDGLSGTNDRRKPTHNLKKEVDFPHSNTLNRENADEEVELKETKKMEYQTNKNDSWEDAFGPPTLSVFDCSVQKLESEVSSSSKAFPPLAGPSTLSIAQQLNARSNASIVEQKSSSELASLSHRTISSSSSSISLKPLFNHDCHITRSTLVDEIEDTVQTETLDFDDPAFADSYLPDYGDFDGDGAFDWGMAMGDDEMRGGMEEPLEEYDLNCLEPSEDEKNDVKVEDNGGRRACPVCAREFSGRFLSEFQNHVNWCIDHSVSTNANVCSTGPKSKAFQSLSTTAVSSSSSNAFSVLMTSHTENNMWAEAQEHDSKSFRPTRGINGKRRKAPFYKVLQGMPIAVDAFRYGDIPGVKAYFLTHAHSDHYTNLSSNWKNGPIYCSDTTANLVIHMLAVDTKWVRPLPMNIPTIVPETGGVTVTLIEANHCPGSCLFLFEGPQTINAGDSAFKSSYIGSSRIFRYLHCGDFRASPKHVLHPAVKGKKLDCIYLDTTYLDPKYCFPPQPLVISACAELAKRLVAGETQSSLLSSSKTNESLQGWVKVEEKDKQLSKGKQKSNGEKVLVVIGTYSIGKERIVKAVAKALQTKIYCDARKAAILRCESDPELHSMLTNDPFSAGVHLVPLGMISSDQFKRYMERWKGKFSRAIGFRPTGWTYVPPSGTEQLPGIPFVISRDQARTFTYSNLRPMRNSTPQFTLYGVPYSEHSSFFELTCFALSLDWVKIVATVNVHSQTSRGKIAKWIDKWESERRKRGRDGTDGDERIVKFRTMDYW